MAADMTIALVFFPTRTGEIAADDAFDRERFGAFDKDRPAFLCRGESANGSGHPFGIGGDHVMRDFVKKVEPEIGKGSQQRSFARDGGGQDTIESGDSVTGDDEELIVVKSKDFAHFTPVAIG